MPLKVAIVPVTLFAQNCSILVDDASGRAAIVDPGGDLPSIRGAIDELKVTPERIFLTHGHIDHAGGAAELAEALSIPVEGPGEADAFLLARLAESGRQFGMSDARAVTPSRWLKEGDAIEFGGLKLEVLSVPGHTPGHVVFVHRAARLAIVGDTLFAGSIGRTDFAYGDHAALMQGIKKKLFALGDDFTILPGHGPASTIGAERQDNPFLRK
jgi:glyoxylase-like metal-dependent hydrolase (beta-lactamase superfamily II)